MCSQLKLRIHCYNPINYIDILQRNLPITIYYMRIIINILTKNYLLLDNHNPLNNNSYHLHHTYRN